jgi:CHAD domain-containing protein
MADGKWIAGLTPRMPLVEAAQTVLPARFLVVLHYLPKAAESAARDVEHVHQLRVASRRAAAALQLFGLCLPIKRTKAMRENLRTLRRSAGAARDWDVFYEMVQTSPALTGAQAQPTRDFLLGTAAARRMAAQALLVEVAEREGREFHKETRSLIHGSFEWQRDGKATLGDLARHHHRPLARNGRTDDAAADQV